MHIPKNYLGKSMRTIMKREVFSTMSKMNIVIAPKEDALNIKNSNITLELNTGKEEDIFKKHLMLNLW